MFLNMPIEITMPALSPTMTEGNLVKWLKKEGDKIKSGDIIAEIETDKATMELEASNSGTMGKIIMKEGSEGVKVNTLIALLLKEGEDASSLKNYTPKEAPAKSVETKPEAAPVKKTEAIITSSNSEKIFVSPLAKRIAEEKNINLKTIEGTGPNGRIVKADLEGSTSSKVVFTNTGRATPEYEIKPVPSVRKVIAKRLLESKQTVPHFYLSLDVCMDEILNAREKVNKTLEKSGIKISVNDFIIKASALAMRDFPAVNSSWSESGIVSYTNVDISVAVSTDGGLITPIVKNADLKSLSAISTEMKNLAKKARDGKLKPEEFQGGGFSISNLGMYGITSFNAIINPPQSAILAVGTTVKKALFCEQEKEFYAANIMNLTLSSDHRIVDGALGAEFLNKIKLYLENPIMLSI